MKDFASHPGVGSFVEDKMSEMGVRSLLVVGLTIGVAFIGWCAVRFHELQKVQGGSRGSRRDVHAYGFLNSFEFVFG